MGTAADIQADDRRLIALVLHQGDEGAFRELYRRYTPRLLGFVARLMAGAAGEAEDVVQETWIRACEGLSRFRWNSSFGSWLHGIGLNVAREQLRREAGSRVVLMDRFPDIGAPEGRYDDRIDLERAIRMLPDEQRIVLVLHDIEGMKHREIAARLGIPVGTSKSHLSRSRLTLRAMLSGVEESEHERG
jgi:RNA polymerase sigma-70 factor (ECF subfamily)